MVGNKIERLRDLKGLGPESQRQLNTIGIDTRADLEAMGPARAFLKLGKERNKPPSLNFLYAMVGALEDRHWLDIAQSEKCRLLMELDGYRDLEQLVADSYRGSE